MKKIVLLSIIFLYQNIFALETESNLEKFGIKIDGNFKDGYSITKDNKLIYKNLKFVKAFSYDNMQIIDKNNNIFFLDRSLERSNMTLVDMINYSTIHWSGSPDYRGYRFEIKEKDDRFIITTKNYNNHVISNNFPILKKLKVDELFFIGKLTMARIYIFPREPYPQKITKNVFSNKPKKTMLIYKKNGKYSFLGEIVSESTLSPIYIAGMTKFYIQKPKDKVFFDEIIMMDNVAKLKNNNLVGYYNITKIKYSSLSPFNFYLARFVLPNGETGYIDDEGNEYKD